MLTTPRTRPTLHRLAATLLGPGLGLLVSVASLPAQDPPADPDTAPRAVWFLASLDAAGRMPELDWFQTPLQHLGISARPEPIRAAPPTPPDRTLPLLVWADGGETLPGWLPGWLLVRVHRGHRVILLGDPDRVFDAESGAGVRLQRALGFEPMPGFVDDPLRIDTELAAVAGGWHESPPRRAPLHRGGRSVDPDHLVWVRTRDRRRPDRPRDAVVTGPFGGLARQPFLLEPGDARLAPRWHLDPLRFLRAALGLEGWPVPDPNVVQGLRAFHWSVGSEGLTGRSTVRAGATNLDVLLERLLDPRRLPVTVTVDPFALAAAEPGNRNELLAGLARLADRPFVELALELPGASSAGDDGRGPQAPADAALELARARQLLARWTDREVALVQWRHDPRDHDGARRRTLTHAVDRVAGLLAVETRGFRRDALHPSLLAMPPMATTAAPGAGVLVHHRAPLEALQPLFYTELPGAYRHAATTLAATDDPAFRIAASLRPQFHTAERPARLDALEDLLDTWSDGRSTCSVFSSDHFAAVREVLDPQRCRIQRHGSEGFSFRGFEHCRTVRFDNAATPAIDWARSPGIVGARRDGGSLWLTLGGAEAELRWQPSWQAPAPGLHLRHADRPFGRVVREPGRLRLDLDPRLGPPRQLVLAGAPAGARLRWSLGPAQEAGGMLGPVSDEGTVRFGLEAAALDGSTDIPRTLVVEVLR